jgi:hypothetical protein
VRSAIRRPVPRLGLGGRPLGLPYGRCLALFGRSATHTCHRQLFVAIKSLQAFKAADEVEAGQEQSGITLDDLIGKQPELVGREGV